MRLRLFVLSFAFANLAYNGIQYAMTAQSEPRPTILSGEDMKRILPGHTLLAYDEIGPFQMYFPDPGTVWGQSSTGDVDIGRWWIEDGRYCRAWRRWHDGATRCWLLASYGDNRIVWMDGGRSIQGESLVQPGNMIDVVWPPLLASLDADFEPIAVTNAIAPQAQTEVGDRGLTGGDAQQGSSSNGRSGGGSSSAGSPAGSASVGGSASGGGSSSGSSGSGGSGNGSGKGKGGSASKGDGGGHGNGNGGKGGGKN